MACRLLAAGWNDFAAILPIVVAVLVWVISHFAGQVQPKAQQRRAVGQPKPGGPQPPAKDPLQAEIDEFLRQAQSVREGKPADQRSRDSLSQPTASTKQ